MLMRLLRSHLRPYRNALLLIVALQTVQTSAALTLPTITARIIDNGVLARPKPDIGFIHTWGALMVLVALVQIVFAVGSHVLRRQGRDELRARPAQEPLPPGDRLLGPRSRHLRCAVADHAHHERRAAGADARRDGVHDGDRGADHDGRRRDHGRCARTSGCRSCW